jgi:hypothetical protein
LHALPTYREEYRLTLELFLHLSTEAVKLDVEPTYIRLLINNKVFQLRLAQAHTRSQSTYIEKKIPIRKC